MHLESRVNEQVSLSLSYSREEEIRVENESSPVPEKERCREANRTVVETVQVLA